MHRPLTMVVALASLLCASCTYARDRWNDAKDIFTLGAGEGIGAVARVGPLQTGIGATIDNIALANGEVAVGGLGICGPSNSSPERAAFLVVGLENDGAGAARGKDYDLDHAVVPIRARVAVGSVLHPDRGVGRRAARGPRRLQSGGAGGLPARFRRARHLRRRRRTWPRSAPTPRRAILLRSLTSA